MFQRFYFNADENICANERWLVSYLHQSEGISEDEVKHELRSRREYFGWYECQVSSDIADAFY